jgi:hypothetical protein
MAEPLLTRLQSFDRRWIFLAMACAVVLPLLMPIGLPVKAQAPVKAIYYTIEDLPPGSTVFLALDVDPASTPELEPFYRAAILHLKRKHVKIVFASGWYSAPPLVDRWLGETVDRAVNAQDIAYKRNEDYVWLGFREGKQAFISNLGQDLWATFGGRAADGASLSDIPMMANLRRLGDFALLISISAGSPGSKEYLQLVQSRYHLRMVAAVTAVMTTDLTPYYASGQLLGLSGGMSASAEYEHMVGVPGMGAKGLDVLNIGHIVVILAILFGNVIYFAGRRRGASA